MPTIDLRYGHTAIPFEYDDERWTILDAGVPTTPLTDAELGARLDWPIGSPSLEEFAADGGTVLIVVPDATRRTGCGQVINLVVRRLIAAGTNAFDIRIIFATGIHRRVTESEKAELLTPFIYQRIKTLDHDPSDLARTIAIGTLANGIPVELDRELFEHDHVILIGGVNFHYFAGFTGGRKLICPGLASKRTISQTHKLAFDCETLDRREGVGTARLENNAVHESFVEAARMVKSVFAINTITDDGGNVIDLYCGDMERSHSEACDAYAWANSVAITEKRELVVACCGGYPFDLNMIQAHKSLEAATNACIEGGTIIFVAECSEGLGRDDFLRWFEAADSRSLAEQLCGRYQVNGQTAWSLMQKAERFEIKLISALDASVAEKMRLVPMQSLARAVGRSDKEKAGYIMPAASKLFVKSPNSS